MFYMFVIIVQKKKNIFDHNFISNIAELPNNDSFWYFFFVFVFVLPLIVLKRKIGRGIMGRYM